LDLPVHEILAGWDSFYVIIGSVAGALIGLQFIVIVLVADSIREPANPEIATFGTPTVLHFSAALVLSAVMSAPWVLATGPRLVLAAVGISGTVYVFIVILRALRPISYRPALEDWIWHAALPLLAYLALLVAAIVFLWHPARALFVVAIVALGLVLIGIHNAWDSIIYVATRPGKKSKDESGKE
jgi:hypothetical protein